MDEHFDLGDEQDYIDAAKNPEPRRSAVVFAWVILLAFGIAVWALLIKLVLTLFAI